jgi:nitrate reductase gamma subunit
LNNFVFIYLPFFTVLVFAAGLIYRFYNWSKTPSPGRMTLFPAPSKGSGTFWGVVKESLLFSGLFRGDKPLWGFAWIFHVALLMIIVGHVRVFTDFPALWNALNIDANAMSATFGGAAGIVILITLLLLLFRRFGTKRVREITGFADYFALLLVIAIIITGNMMRFGEHFDLVITRAYFAQLFTFSFATMEIPQNSTFRLHFLLAQLLILYIPFSKILHFGGIFFTQTIIQRS